MRAQLVDFRPLERADWEKVAALAREAELSLDLAALEASVHQEVYVLAKEGDPVAFVAVTLLGAEVEITDLAVQLSERRRGWGRQLLDAFLDMQRARGSERVLLEVSADNRAAIGLYSSVGFGSVGRRVRYYKSGQDAILMDCCLFAAD